MENQTSESCQTCFRPARQAGSQKTQWITVCRCNLPYSPNAEFSIDVCGECNRRVVDNAAGQVSRADLCSCQSADRQNVPGHLKPEKQDEPVILDLISMGIGPEEYPLDKYTPIAVLGRRERADAFLSRDRQFGKKVVVKCFKNVKPELFPLFEQDLRKNKQLSHTSIARLLEFGIHAGKTPYVVSEYKDGFSLEQCLAVHGIPSYDIAVMALLGLCEALLYAQKQNVFHRDIRPGNIIFLDDMNSEPSVSITDFGMPSVIEKQMPTDPVDALYMSAEEARGLEFSEKSEVYSIGCLGFALLTGRPPFQDGSALDIKNDHALKLPPKISTLKFEKGRPGDLEEVIERCLEKDPRDRFESVEKLKERLEVFPRREKMRVDAILAERKKKKLVKVSAIGLVVVALCAIGYFVVGGL